MTIPLLFLTGFKYMQHVISYNYSTFLDWAKSDLKIKHWEFKSQDIGLDSSNENYDVFRIIHKNCVKLIAIGKKDFSISISLYNRLYGWSKWKLMKYRRYIENGNRISVL